MWGYLIDYFRHILVPNCRFCNVNIQNGDVLSLLTHATGACPKIPPATLEKYQARLHRFRADSRELDPEWFQHLTDMFDLKQDYLHERGDGRIANYIPHFSKMLTTWMMPAKQDEKSRNKSKNDRKIRKKTKKVFSRPKSITAIVYRTQVLPLISEVKKLADDPAARTLWGEYFVRGKPEAFCDPAGLFQCQCNPTGECRLKFSINPYDTEAEQIMFEAWEFDHIITQAGLARYVFDNATEVYNSNGKMKFDPEYFYDKLCTKENLRLVFKGCHDKDSRDDSLVIKRAEAIITLP